MSDMTVSDHDRRHRWAETCERLAERAVSAWWPTLGEKQTATDLREIAAYLRAPLAREDAATKEEG